MSSEDRRNAAFAALRADDGTSRLDVFASLLVAGLPATLTRHLERGCCAEGAREQLRTMDTFPLVLSAQMNGHMNGMTGSIGGAMLIMMLLVAIVLILGIAALLRSLTHRVG